MRLHHQDYGKGGEQTIILLHGLLGSSRNWVTVGKLLAQDHHVVGLDLRNHGKSPHDSLMSYSAMVDDVGEWMEDHQLPKAHIVGHSMGGKVAMLFACTNPDRVSSLIIADVAPIDYSLHFRTAFDAMGNIDPSRYNRIAEVDQALAEYLDDSVLRQFLITNLTRNEAGTFDWQVNLEALTQALPELSRNPIRQTMHYNGPCLLLHGEHSSFVQPEDHKMITHHFPECRIVEVPGAGHNVHIDNRHFVSEQISRFLPF